jgi:hypothetical protein
MSMSAYEIPAPALLPTSEVGGEDGEVELRALVEAEERLPLDIFEDRPLRVKKTDTCGLSCNFCHNEGTVAPTPNRQSIYITEGTPPAGLLEADDMQPCDSAAG